VSIVLEHVSKRFGSAPVVDDVDLEIPPGELFVLLGSSGSGKSTILRMIAGLVQLDDGRIVLEGRDVTAVPPQKRGTGFVFQNYSVFRHMTVAQNIEFGLRIRRVKRGERARRREELLELVGLAGFGERYAAELSGGQQQRVAVARALAYEPRVLLLDEPFGALDVKTRVQLRRSLRDIQRRLQLTMILVTHDQEEAFEVADRVGVIERGRLLECGTAEQLYARPRTLFTATFVGAGNVVTGRVTDQQVRLGDVALPLPDATPHRDGNEVQVLIRPENVVLGDAAPPPGVAILGRGRIVQRSFTGPAVRTLVQLPAPSGTRQIAPAVENEELAIEALVPAAAFPPAESVWVGLRAWHILEEPQPGERRGTTGLRSRQ